MQQVFNKNQFRLKALFEYLQKRSTSTITAPYSSSKDEIPNKIFSWFCNHFNLFPFVLSTTEANLIFKSVTRYKKTRDGHTIGINYLEFLECLLRVAVKGQNIFNKFAERMK